jgi:hypothetical protein
MSKNVKYIYSPLAMSNDIIVGEGWDGGIYEVEVVAIRIKARVL